MDLPFPIETELEARICADPEWKKGAVWGKPRPGHSEGAVMYHIAEVLANVDRLATTQEERRMLRLIALIHDTFKFRVDPSKPKIGANHHAVIARKFAERYLDDLALLEIIELHDEAYNSWRSGASKGRWREAEERASRLVARLGSSLPLYLRFYRADNATGSKEDDSLIWFEQFLRRRRMDVPPEVGEAR
jgi:HD domain